MPAPLEPTSRAQVREWLEAALNEPVYSGKIYYLVGEAGIGKTHILRWLHDLALEKLGKDGQEREKGYVTDLLETGIIDLVHSRYQQPLLLMEALAKRIAYSLKDKRKEAFDAFHNEAKRYLSLVETERHVESLDRVRNQFLEGYRQATDGYRVLITLDTLERLDPRLPEVEAYETPKTERLDAWLAGLLTELPNSLTIIAGRPRERQAKELQQRLGERLLLIKLPPLRIEEVKEVVEEYGPPDDSRDLPWYERMYKLSGGVPVRLILALEIARVCKFDPEHLPPSLESDVPDDQKLGEDFQKQFIKDLHDNKPNLAHLLNQAFYLRKGLYPELLQALDGGPGSAIEENLKQFGEFKFVKISGDGILTLHDAVYDLLEEHPPQLSPEWFDKAITYLWRQQEKLSEEIAQYGMDLDRLSKLRTLQIDRLYYQLARQRLEGYQNYCELTYGAIFSRDREFDTQLQDELARFFDPQSKSGEYHRKGLEREGYSWKRIVYDEAARWVFRCFHAGAEAGGGRDRALKLAARIEADFQDLLEADGLARSVLEVARLEIEGLAAEGEEQFKAVEERYKKLMQTLQEVEKVEEQAEYKRSIHKYRSQQSRFLRAYALNNWGYLARRQLRLNTAIERYRQAIELYKKLDEEKGDSPTGLKLGGETRVFQGVSLTNLSFAYRLQGQQEAGLIVVGEAIRLLHSVAARYREAAAQSTRAQLFLDLNDAWRALRSIERARTLLGDFPDSRNEALFKLIESSFLRRQAYHSSDYEEQSEEIYKQAEDGFRYCLEYFNPNLGERERSIEARHGLGCTYRSRARVRQRRGEVIDKDLEEARRWFKEALDLTDPGDGERLADLHEDIAQTYVLEKRYGEALQELDLAAGTIPPAFDVRPHAGAVETADTREQRRFWLMRSKVDLQRGVCYLGKGEPEKACEHFLRAFACLLRFSPESPLLRSYRETVSESLLQYYRQPQVRADNLQTLRHHSYLVSQHLNVREAFWKLEQVFDTVEQILKLLY